MPDGFEIKFDFMEKWGRIAKPEYLQIYIYLYMRYKKDGLCLPIKEAAAKLHTKTALIEEALDFWSAAGYVISEADSYSFAEESVGGTAVKTKKPVGSKSRTSSQLRIRPAYEQAEIDAAARVNEKIDYMFKQAEKILGRLLTTNDLELLYSFVDWLGLPVEVVIMLLNYAAKLKKTDKRYLEVLAIDWADREINTYEAAEAYIKEMEEVHSAEWKIRSILGIYDRALTQTEKKYIKSWTQDKKYSPELVSEAYERTVNSTGKLSFAYMNKILLNWGDQGYKTTSDVLTGEKLFKAKNAPIKKRVQPDFPNKSRFNNFSDSSNTDYSELAEEILSDMLDE